MALLTLILATWGCSGEAESGPGAAAEWREVLALKPGEDADPAQRQAYANALNDFLTRHPDHSRAREVWDELELEYAWELASNGSSEAAIARLEKMVARRAGNAAEAGELLRVLREQRHVTDQELEALEEGMSVSQVSERLGNPPRGWKRRTGSHESWFYRHERGGTAAVHFRSGRLLAVEAPEAVRAPKREE